MTILISLLGCMCYAQQDTVYVQNEYVVFFEKNSFSIEEECLAKLDEIPENSVVCVTGLSSPEGNAEKNIELSQRRADEVSAYLRRRNIKVDSSVGLGAQGAASNRIVVIHVL